MSQPASAAQVPDALAWLDPTAPRGNSNAWVVSGRRTATGRPILANDPHLLIELPSVWYEMHLVAAGLDVQGVAVPGTPFVAIGHNARIAWGFTNTGADVQDFVVERIDTAGRRVQSAPRLGAGAGRGRADSGARTRRARAVPDLAHAARASSIADESLDWETPPAWLSPDAPASGGAARARPQVVGLRERRFRRRVRGRRSRRQLGGVPGGARPALGAVAERGVCRRRRQHRLPDDRVRCRVRARGDGTRPGSAAEVEWAGAVDRVGPAAAPQPRRADTWPRRTTRWRAATSRSSPATGRRRSAPPA